MRNSRLVHMLSASRVVARRCSSDACRELLRKHDYENYFIGLIAARHIRPDYYTIHAFNAEMALVKYSVRGNSTAGRMRYKWWNDYIGRLYNDHSNEAVAGGQQHPVADALKSLIQRKRLSRRWFESIIEARTRDLLPPQINTLGDLEDSVEKTHSSVLYLTLESLGVVETEEALDAPVMHMASHIGCAFGIVAMLRGVPHDLSKGEVRLPCEQLLQLGLPPEQLLQAFATGVPLSPKGRTALQEVVFDVASQAHAHLSRARDIQTKELTRDLRSRSIIAMLPAVLADDYLRTLQTVDFDMFHSDILAASQQQQSPFMMQMRLLRALWMKTV